VSLADVQAAVSAAEIGDDDDAVSPEPRREPLTGVRKIIAERMSASAHTTAPVTLMTEADATELVQLRRVMREHLEVSLGHAPSYVDILVFIVARALREYPYMNARLAGEEIEVLPVVNVGVAVDTENGLLVPVIRDADTMGIADIGRMLRELATQARAGQSMPDDLRGGTFTITNLGMYDVDGFTPIINPPECAILGAGRIREQPAVRAGQVCVRSIMVLSLTFDHRLVDGAPAARFLQRIKQLVEQPSLLLA
jgi:pyruvate dehydrogenase E2 component (dihydrolipoamide acetyltransferase)